MKIDVLINGAGPVGLTLASELTRFGLKVRIVDKSAARTDKSKALVVWPRTLELLDRSAAGAALLAAGQRCEAVNLMSGAKTLAHIKLNEVDSPHPFALMVPQSETERVLEEHCGVQVERRTELTAFTQNTGSVTCTLHRNPGSEDWQEETLEAAWLIGCDGAHSFVRHQLNMPFEGSTLLSDWMLADVHLHGLDKPGEVHIFLHHEGALAIFPIGNDATGRARVIANATCPDPTLADVQTVLDRRGPGNVTASDPVWLANFTINERKVASYRAGRVFLAGDAAHIHSPAGGQGMNTGMQDACNLAWKLALVHHGRMKEPLLDTYTAERSPVAAQVLKQTGALTAVGTLHNEALLAIRNTAISLVLGLNVARDAMAEQLTELSISYPESPLNRTGSPPHNTPKPGERAPIRPGETPVGAGDTPRFALYAAGSANADQFIACFPEVLEAEPRKPFAAGGIWLVRPDGYVAFASDVEAWPAMDAYMVELIYGMTR